VLGLAGGQGAAHADAASPYAGDVRITVVAPPTGLYLGASAVALAVLDESGGPDLLSSGTGLRLFGGWRLGGRLALELGWMSTFHDAGEADADFGSDAETLSLIGFTGDAKIFLGRLSERTEVFALGGVGFYLLDSEYLGARSIGSGFQAGAGVDVHLSPDVDLGGRAIYRGIALGPPDPDDDDTFASALGLELGVALRF
jgi:hypothetical protein